MSGTNYTVKRGDTLSAIASRFDTSVKNIVALNNISNRDLILPDQVLIVPAQASVTASSYVVKSGDTLTAIAKKFGTSIEFLATQNHLINPHKIQAGQELKLSQASVESDSKKSEAKREPSATGPIKNNTKPKALKISESTAIYSELEKIFSDQSIDENDAAMIYRLCFGDGDGFAQVQLENYIAIKQTWEMAAQKDFANPVDQDRLELLLKSFPGSLEHFQVQLNQNGLPEIDVFSLPEPRRIRLNQIHFNDENHVSVDFEWDNSNLIWDFDLQQDLLSQFDFSGPSQWAILSDLYSHLMQMQNKSLLDEGEIKFCQYLLDNFDPFPNPASGLSQSMEQIYKNLGDEGNIIYNPDTTAPKLQSGFNMNSIVPVQTDNSLSLKTLATALSQMQAIVGKAILTLLEERGWTFKFCDFTMVEELEQSQDSLQQRSNLYGIPDHGAVPYFDKKEILFDTRTSVDILIMHLVHEIGHALNFEIQENANATEIHAEASDKIHLGRSISGYEITGPQMDEYASRIINGYWWSMSSNYGSSTHVECFAENFTYFMIERSGRQDLLTKKAWSRHPYAGKCLMAVDGWSDLVMNKIVQTIENRNTDFQSFTDLMRFGIDEHFSQATWNFWRQQINDSLLAQMNQEVQENGSSDIANLIHREWSSHRLHELYNTESQYDLHAELVSHFNDLLQNISLSHAQQEITRLADSHIQDRIADAWILTVALAVTKAKTLDEKIQLLLDNDLTGQEALEQIMSQCNYLEEDLLWDFFTKDELIYAAEEKFLSHTP